METFGLKGDPRTRLDPAWLESARSTVRDTVTHETDTLASTQMTEALVDLFSDKFETATCIIAKLNTLAEALILRPSNRQLFIHLGGPQILVYHMARRIDHRDVQVASCRLISSIPDFDEDTLASIGQTQGVFAVFDTLVRYAKDLEPCLAAMVAMRLLSFSPSNRVLLQDESFLRMLVLLMIEFRADQSLSECVASTIAMVTFGNDWCREKCGELGVIAALSDIMKAHPTCAPVQGQCGLALRNLSWGSKSNCRRASESDCIKLLFDAMVIHSGLQKVVNESLGSLGNMVSTLPKLAELIVQNRPYIDQIFTELLYFANDSCLSDKACTLLLLLCEHDMIAERVGIRVVSQSCIKMNGPSSIAAALQNACAEKNKEVVARFGKLIRVLSLCDCFRESVGKSRTLPVLLDALSKEAVNEKVVLPILEGLEGMLSGNDGSKRMFTELDGAGKIIEVMQANVTHEKVIMQCCKVLDNASDGQETTAEELMKSKEKAIKAVMEAMANFAQSAQVQEFACSMLIKVASISTADASKMVQIGVRNSVEAARSFHGGNPAVESLANQLLSLLQDPKSTRASRGSARGTASARLRSRSRTVGQMDRARSRAEKSRSPERMLKVGRRALLAAQKSESAVKEDGDGPGIGSNGNPPATVYVKRATRKTMLLDTVYE